MGLFGCCAAHIIQDGLVALQYVLLPVLAQSMGLSYAQVGFLRALSNMAMSVLEIPAAMLAERWGERRLIGFGLVFAGIGYLGVAFSSSFLFLSIFLFLTGVGASFQHALCSSVIVGNTEATERRRAMGTYNSAGDAGKLLFTGLFSLSIGAGIAWNLTVIVLSSAAIGFGFLVTKWLTDSVPGNSSRNVIEGRDTESLDADGRALPSLRKRWGIKHSGKFSLLCFVILLDSLVQAVFLTFLAFIMIDKGLTEGVASLSVVIALVGGMVGKYVCGAAAARFSDRYTFVGMQALTVVGIIALIQLPASYLIVLLPLIGLVVQGTSTVTYGSVADLVSEDRQSRGYALVYASSGLSSVFGPMIVGAVADSHSLEFSMWGLVVIAFIPILFAFIFSKKGALSQ